MRSPELESPLGFLPPDEVLRDTSLAFSHSGLSHPHWCLEQPHYGRLQEPTGFHSTSHRILCWKAL